MLISEGIDNDTVSVFELQNTDQVVLTKESRIPEIVNELEFIYSAFFRFDDLKLSDAGEYTCTGVIYDAVNSSFIIQSNEAADSGSIVIKSKWKSFSHLLFISYLC